jgi:hypothetical protein
MNTSRKAITWMVLSAVLFVALHPGVLLTVPSATGSLADMVTVNAPSLQVVVHAVVFAVVLNVVGGILKKIGVMGRKVASAVSSARSSPKK